MNINCPAIAGMQA